MVLGRFGIKIRCSSRYMLIGHPMDVHDWLRDVNGMSPHFGTFPPSAADQMAEANVIIEGVGLVGVV